MHERVPHCQVPKTDFVLFCESLGVSRINHILRVHGRTFLHEGQAATIFDEVGQRSLERLFPGFTEDSSEHAAPSAGQSGFGSDKSVDVARPAHLGALMAAKPRILDMNRGAATVCLLPEQPLPARLDTLVGTASTALLDALDDSENPTARLYLQKAAQAAAESWQQTVQGYNGPTITSTTIPEIEQIGPTSQHDDDSEPTFAPHRKIRLSAPQLQAQLSRQSDRTQLRRLKNTLHTKGVWQQITRIEDLCHTHVSHKWLYHLDACVGGVLTPHDHITNVQKKKSSIGAALARADVVYVDHSWTTSLGTVRSSAPLKPPEGTMLAFTPFWED